MGLTVELVQPKVLLVLTTHLDAFYQQGHQLCHCFRLSHSDQDLGLFKQLDLKGDAASFLKNLAKVFIVGDPISFDELVFKQHNAFRGLFIGVGGEAKRQVLQV